MKYLLAPARTIARALELAGAGACRRTWGARALLLLAALGAVGCGRLGYDARYLRPTEDAATTPGDAATRSDGGVEGTDASTGPVDASPPARTVAEIDAHYRFTCARLENGEVWCWGANESCQSGNSAAGIVAPWPSPVLGSSDAAAFAVGGIHACIVRASGEIACWGDNEHGQLGAAAPATSCAPVRISGLSGVTALAAGYEHTCATTEAGVVCWGRNIRGQLGDGTLTSRPTPALVAGTEDTIALTAGYYFTCRIARGGQVWCWGDDADGQLGLASTGTGGHATRPGRAIELGDAVAIEAGQRHACARRASGEVTCWGSNTQGQLGDGTAVPRDYAGPVVAGFANVATLQGGEEHTCAVHAGTVTCWGAGTWGQLGDGAGEDHFLPGPSALGMTDVVSMTAGKFHTCAVQGGRAYCWGWNADGQLGIGTTSDTPRLVPAQVAF